QASKGRVALVGEDWGRGHVARLACTWPELIRSWTIDIAGCFEPEYVWHARGRVWQTPEAGEAAVARMAAMPLADRVAQFESLGMSAEIAGHVAAATNAAMGRCILALYRSARQPAIT